MEQDVAALEAQMADLEFKRMFNQPADPNNCFIDITAGAGGTEAEDWRACFCACICAMPSAKALKWTCSSRTTAKSQA